jgi:uncharacterized protein (TIGR00661 family)
LSATIKGKKEIEGKRILFSVLDWGLGHAVRDVPLIQRLISEKAKVTIVGSGPSLEFLKEEFPDLEFILVLSHKVRYSKSKFFFLLKLALQIPSFIFKTVKEHNQLKRLIKHTHYDLIISDNRYGFYHQQIPSIFITHQIFPKIGRRIRFIEPILSVLHKRLINNFDLCLIPDYPGEINLSGDLSHKYKLGSFYRYIGIVSSFNIQESSLKSYERDILFISSGPEPQRELFFKQIFNEIYQDGFNALMIRGIPKLKEYRKIGKIEVVGYLRRRELLEEIQKSRYIITQSGYTSLMDLIKIKRHAIIIPTPGQTEQEYLAELQINRGWFITYNRENFVLRDAIDKVEKFSEPIPETSHLEHDDFLKIIKQVLILR